jgi:isoquinoline 1-oxidoreductase beta subunit
VEIALVDSAEAPGGIGEVGTAIAAPALCNAIFAATGVRLRALPVRRDLLVPNARASIDADASNHVDGGRTA